MRLPGRRRLQGQARVPVAWDLGLGRELGYVFWAMIGVEAAFGSYVGIWPLWIEALGAPITVVGLVLGSAGLLRLLTLAPSAALADRIDPRTLIVAARSMTALGMISAAFATHWTMLAPMVIGSAIGEIAFPLTQAHLAAHAGEQRVRAFTLVFNVGPAVAFGIAPLISGALIARFDMRAAFIFAAACTAFSLFFFSRFTPRPKVAKEDEPTRSSYREALAEPGVKPLLGMQFATIFSLALGISLLAPFLADQRGISPAVVAMLGGVGSLGAVIFGLAVARSQWLQRHPLAGITIAIGMVMVALAIILSTHLIWLIALAFIGRGGLWSAWGLSSPPWPRSRAATACGRALHPERDDGGIGVLNGPDHLWAALRHPCRRSAAGLTGRQRRADPGAVAGPGRMRPGRTLTNEEESISAAAPLADPEAA